MNLESNVIDRLNLQYGRGSGGSTPKRPNLKGILLPLLVIPVFYLAYKLLFEDSEKGKKSKSDETFLPLLGGTMQGDIIVPFGKYVNITNEPIEDEYATNKKYVDNTVKDTLDKVIETVNDTLQNSQKDMSNIYLPKTGGTLTGPLDFQNGTVTLLFPPQQPEHAVNKQYVDAQNETIKTYVNSEVEKSTATALKTFLPLTGGILTGDLNVESPHTINISSTPISDNDAINKKYLDDAINDIDSAINDKITNAKTYIDNKLEEHKTNISNIYLPLTGGALKGTLVIPASHSIIVEDLPAIDTSATNKLYVDTQVNNALEYSENKFNELSLSITNYQSNADKMFLPLTGGTMTGNITMGPAARITVTKLPASDDSAVNKLYVDTEFTNAKKDIDATINTSITTAVSQQLNKTFLPLTGGTLTGDLTSSNILVSKQPTVPTEATNKLYVDNSIATNKTYMDTLISELKTSLTQNIEASKDTTPYLPLTGGTLTGPLIASTISITQDPVNAKDAINKSFLDKQIADAKQANDTKYLSLTGGTMKGSITSDSFPITLNSDPKDPNHAVNKKYVDSAMNLVKSEYLSLSGGTMSGTITMSPNTYVEQPSDPQSDNDAVNKKYVDNRNKRSYYQYSGVKIDDQNNILFTLLHFAEYNATFNIKRLTGGTTTSFNFLSGSAADSEWRIHLSATFPKTLTLSFVPEVRPPTDSKRQDFTFQANIQNTIEILLVCGKGVPGSNELNVQVLSDVINVTGTAILTVMQIA